MTLAEITVNQGFILDRRFFVNNVKGGGHNECVGYEGPIKAEHGPGTGDEVRLSIETMVPDSSNPSGTGWEHVPIEGIDPIPPGTSATFILRKPGDPNGMRVTVNHQREPEEIIVNSISRIHPRRAHGTEG